MKQQRYPEVEPSDLCRTLFLLYLLPIWSFSDGTDVVYRQGCDQQVLKWSTVSDPLLYGMSYNDGKLIIQKEGYYYVYSKINFLYDKRFHHTVLLRTHLYKGKDIPLLQARRSSEGHETLRSNSFLGGVFQLNKNDAIYVKVNNVSQIIRHKSYENTFGAYMIWTSPRLRDRKTVHNRKDRDCNKTAFSHQQPFKSWFVHFLA